jgi:ankyrin repeat protein
MDRSLLVAAISGDEVSMKNMASQNPSLLLATTPQGNTCLHISSIHGHMRFCKEILALRLNDHNPLLATVNADGETPLLTAVTSGHPSLASLFLICCHELKLSEAILKRDKNGCNALHHAIRSGHRELALELIAAEPALSRAVNQYNESPMFIAVMRGLTDVFEKLLKTPGSADAGACGYNALHAAVKNGNSGQPCGMPL